ncbi:CHC2 zinc finger domain-containing protein [Nitrosomonas communis]|uniref:CHC2 zinc finger n=1 Tax=Nitrosomonas communis TaxID=44574 RepID=A0A1I4RPY1_9PROT|nr:CHC2 zinc finger domain-containing protein [Nitrosomonas communis]SFM54317.1 CHC2 zinc finger [Nitrosomonas communis]
MRINKKKAVRIQAKAALSTSLSKSNFKSIATTHQSCILREQLPSPIFYYKQEFASIISYTDWINVRCCFHDDKNPSLSINLKNGGFFCHACGAKGGDVIDFHRLRYGLGFRESVLQLKRIKGRR